LGLSGHMVGLFGVGSGGLTLEGWVWHGAVAWGFWGLHGGCFAWGWHGEAVTWGFGDRCSALRHTACPAQALVLRPRSLVGVKHVVAYLRGQTAVTAVKRGLQRSTG
jgi:hypothetical protein